MADSVVIRGRIRMENVIRGNVYQMLPVFPAQYTGPTTITPGPITQTLATAELMVPVDIIIEPIPSNYGLITYNGSILTVS